MRGRDISDLGISRELDVLMDLLIKGNFGIRLQVKIKSYQHADHTDFSKSSQA